ncbi:hypothetical protein V1478_015349, partial [Vespula squamosa]
MDVKHLFLVFLLFVERYRLEYVRQRKVSNISSMSLHINENFQKHAIIVWIDIAILTLKIRHNVLAAQLTATEKKCVLLIIVTECSHKQPYVPPEVTIKKKKSQYIFVNTLWKNSDHYCKKIVIT